MLIDEIENLNTTVLVAAQIFPLIGVDYYSTYLTARYDQVTFGYPVIVAKTRVKIPRLPFLKLYKAKLLMGKLEIPSDYDKLMKSYGLYNQRLTRNGEGSMDLLKKIEQMDCAVISLQMAAKIIGMSPETLRYQAVVDKTKLGFPVIIAKGDTTIPRLPFINFLRNGNALDDQTFNRLCDAVSNKLMKMQQTNK